METFIQSIDFDLWILTIQGSYILMKDVHGVKTPKTFEYDEDDKKNMTLNAKAKNILTCSLGKNKYSRVSSCTSVFEMSKLLEMTHEGTSQVKNSKINIVKT